MPATNRSSLLCGSWSARQRFGLYYYYYIPQMLPNLRLPLVLWLHGGLYNTADNLTHAELARSAFFHSTQKRSPAVLLRPLASLRPVVEVVA